MDPIIVGMIAVILITQVYGIISERRKCAHAPATKAIAPVGADEHRLVKTWISHDEDYLANGWRWKCACGSIGGATDIKVKTYTESGTLGSEISAINRYKAHAQGYKEANGNEWKEKHDELQKKFDEAQKACYCKETSSIQLVPLKG